MVAMPRLFVLLTLLALLPRVAYAYAAFEEIRVAGPEWLRPAIDPAEGIDAAYRVRRGVGDQLVVEIRNRSAEQLRLRARLAGYQDPEAVPFELVVPAGQTSEVSVPTMRHDQNVFQAPMTLLAVTAGERALRVLPATAPGGPSEPPAWTATCASDVAGFDPAAIAYQVRPLPGGMVEIHVKNRSRQAIHADFILLGHQPRTARNPRLHLLPGRMCEVVMAVTGSEAQLGAATLELSSVRLGEDRGPALAGPAGSAARFPLPEGYFPLNHADTGLGGWNPAAAVWRAIDLGAGRTALIVRNVCPQPLAITVALGGVSAPFDLPVGGEATATLAVDAKGIEPAAETVAIAGQVVTAPSAPTAANPPQDHLVVAVRGAAPHVNPRTIAYAVTRAGDAAEVAFVNLSAATIDTEWALVGYQDATTVNPRLTLAAGAAVTVRAVLARRDARLPLARIEVWDVRVGGAGTP